MAVLLSGLALALVAGARTSTDPTAGLPDDAESTSALRAQQQLPATEYAPAIAVFDRGGERLTAADRRAVAARVTALRPLAAQGQRTFPQFSEDGQAALVGVPLSTSLSESAVRDAVQAIREAAAEDLPAGLEVSVTGGPAFETDLGAVFDGADVRLLLTTVAVVALLLLLTYRSPWLWLVPLAVVGTADQVAAKAVAVAVDLFGFTVDESTIGITSVLVFGAGTNYALLLIARYREELRLLEDRYDAMRVALSPGGARRSWPARRRSCSPCCRWGSRSTRATGASGSRRRSASSPPWSTRWSCCRRRCWSSGAGCSGRSCRAPARPSPPAPGSGPGWGGS